MSHITTVGKILLKHNTPAHLHEYIQSTELDSKGLNSLFSKMAEGDPDIYKESVSNLTRLGFEVSTRLGSTVRLADLISPIDKEKKFKELAQEIKQLKETIKDPRKFAIALDELYQRFSKEIEKEIVDVGVKNNKTLAKVIRAGARGKPAQYRQTVFSPMVVTGPDNEPLNDFPIEHSYAEGLTLPEYLLSSFGARVGEVAKKLSVADAGYFSKQLSRAGMTLKIEEHDCGTDNGIPVSVDDKDSIGSFLAKPILAYKKNNEVSAAMLNALKNKSKKELIVRSPITCQSSRKYHTGALCQLCVGKRGEDRLPPIDSFIGLTASSGLGETLAQSTLNVRHSSGSAAGGAGTASGFKLVERLSNIPKQFPEKAAVAEIDGEITDVRDAPQGGCYINQGNKEYYVPAGFDIKVKKGQYVEAGDVLSDGVVNPAEIVKYKGIGEGRRYFATTMKKAFDESGMGGINRRNFEIVAKSAIDHVKVTNPEGFGEHWPGEIISYQTLEKNYQPRPDSKTVRIDQAYNKYLEQPVLHYSIGDRITHRRIQHLKDHDIESVIVHDKKPEFEPEMQRLLDVPIHEHDWMHQLYSTNLERRLLSAVNSGARSDLRGPSPIPGLAYAIGFGEKKLPKQAEESFHGKTTYEGCGHESNCRCMGPHDEPRTVPGCCPLCNSESFSFEHSKS